MEHREYWYWLLTARTLNYTTCRKLLRSCGSPEEIWRAGHLDLTENQCAELAARRAGISSIMKEYHTLLKKGVRMVLEEDSDYPNRLHRIPDAPPGLFLKGRLPKENVPSAAIVGSRKASPHGKWMAEQLAYDLAYLGFSVISGMAEGIDGCGHRGALDAGGNTYAVLGCGIDQCYPRSHSRLEEEILENGGVLSEYGPGAPGLPVNFPNRNRIISGLSDVVIVVEARERSGSLITADRALEQGREVMAVPGRPDDNDSEGCNRLIKQGAAMCTGAEDVLHQLDLSPDYGTGKKVSLEKIDPVNSLNAEERIVLSALSGEPKHVERIASETGLSITELWSAVMKLELMGYVRSVTAGMYQRGVY